ncbi:MAG TPA: signal recognition particle protein [Actinomycetota bacterium]|nr:signal recognition particle protein [Actinomycetota bacterium]
MFESLSDRLETAFARLRRKGRLTKEDVEEGLKEIRTALLEADVSLPVVRNFLERVREQAVGDQVLRSLTPGQHIVKIVHDELVALLGGQQRQLIRADKPPTVILLVGLQGSGKTTAAAKLAAHLKARGTRPLLAACDLQRPAAVEQLRQLGAQVGVAVEAGEAGGDPVKTAAQALKRARTENFGALIVDSAGRLTVDEEMMEQARSIRDAVSPHETLLVLDSMTGQDAVQTAESFAERLDPTGAILTKLDGDARGGAALSLVEAAGVPIVFAGTGERIEDLEPFHPDRIASRILGMGDVLSLIEKAESAIAEEDAEALERKIREATFDLKDFLDQLQMVRQMGPIQNLVGLMPNIPGVGRISDQEVDEGQLTRVESIIRSMTPQERAKPELINASRRRRIAEGSGNQPQDVNNVLKQFDQMRKMMRQMAGAIPGKGRKGASRKARRGMPKMKGF